MAATLLARGRPVPHMNLYTTAPSSEHGSIPEINSANYPDINYDNYLYSPDYSNYARPSPPSGPTWGNQNRSPSPLSSLGRVVESGWQLRGGEMVFERGAQIQEVDSNADAADLQALEFREQSLPPDTTPPPPPRPHLASLGPSLAPSTQNSPRYQDTYLGPATVPNSPTLSQSGSPWPPSRRRTETHLSDSSLWGTAPAEARPILDQAAVASRLADVLDQPLRRALSPYRRPLLQSSRQNSSSSGRPPLPGSTPRPRRGRSLLSRSTTLAAWNISPMPTPNASFQPPVASSPPQSQPEGRMQSSPEPQTPNQAAPQPQPSSPRQAAPQRMSPRHSPSGLHLASLPSFPLSPQSPSSTASRQQAPSPPRQMSTSPSSSLQRPPTPPSQRRSITPSTPPQPAPSQPQQAQNRFQPFPYPPMTVPPANPYDSRFVSGYTGYPDPSSGGPSTPSSPQFLQFPGGPASPGVNNAQNAYMEWQAAAEPRDFSHLPDTRQAWPSMPETVHPPMFQNLPGPSGSSRMSNTWPPTFRSANVPQSYTPFAPFPVQLPTQPQRHPAMFVGGNQSNPPFTGFPQQPPPLSIPQQHQPRVYRRPSSQSRAEPHTANAGPSNSKGKQPEGFAPSLGAPRFQSTPPRSQHRNPPPRWQTPPADVSGLLETNMRHLEFALGDIDGLTAYFGKADQYHDVNPHGMMSRRVRAGLHTLSEVLTRQRSLKPEQLQLGSERWHEKCADRLGSLWRTIQSFGRFAHAISGRQPTISTLTKALAKLSEFESKISSLTSKFTSLLNRLRVRHLYSLLSRAHIEANEQLRSAQSKRDLPRWEEGKLYRAELRREYVDFRNRIARGRRASLTS
ncbi:hypothetical protein FPV67DRAFT_1676278 [Lyophyllum atratum]|nr:hypothetical protein FPV67DRAFT_1676278 [Lyophyllum atratum]